MQVFQAPSPALRAQLDTQVELLSSLSRHAIAARNADADADVGAAYNRT